MEFFDTNGNRTGGATVEADTNDDELSAPSIAASSDGGYLVVYTRERASDGTFDIVSRHVNANGTVDAEQSVFDSSDTSTNPETHEAEVVALANGNYVVAFVNPTNNFDPQFKFVGQNGTVSGGGAGLGFQVSINNAEETDIQIAALSGGGFVVAWLGLDGASAGIRYSVYDSNGANVKVDLLGGGFVANETTAGLQSGPDVAGLRDGGFVVVWHDSGRNGDYGQRFDAGGNKVGGEFKVASGTTSSAAVAGLEDGRFVAGHDSQFPGSDVLATIFDPRDAAISGDGGDNVITSRIDGGVVNGLGGDDDLLGQDGSDELDGGSGRDRVNGGDGKDWLSGGADKDTFVFDFDVSSKKAAKPHKDKVIDFSHKADSIELDADAFTGLKPGKLKKKDFGSGTDKASKDKHLVYWHEKSGKLFYDANGKKKGGDVEIAKFNKDADLAANDFFVV